MSEWLKKGWTVVLAAVLLAGCGGSGSSDDSDTGTPTGPVAASVELTTDKLSLASSGVDTAEIRALVKDANNVVIASATVNFSSTTGSLAVTQPTTDATGLALASLGTGGDPANRNITVTATVAGTSVTDTLVIPVSGTEVAVTAPANVTSGSTATVTVTVRDSDGNGIGNQSVTVTSSLGNTFTPASPVTTNASGSATLTYTATASGSDTLTASALGDLATQNVTVSGSAVSFMLVAAPTTDITIDDASTAGALEGSVTATLTWVDGGAVQAGEEITFSTTRGKFDVDGSNTATGADSSVQVLTTDAAGQAVVRLYASNAGAAVITATATNGPSTQVTIPFVSVKPASLAISASPSSIGPSQQSTIRATVRDALGNLVKNARVLFTLEDVSGGSISPGFADTNSSGVASTVYTSNASSATDGVRITATVNNCDADQNGTVAVGEICSQMVPITVAQTSLFISIGTGNNVEIANTTTYRKEFSVFITDSNGNARPNQDFIVSVIPLPNDLTDTDFSAGDATDDPATTDGRFSKSAYFKGFYVWNDTAGAWGQVTTEYCRNEDLDLDGTEDPGEDINDDGELTPGNGNVAVDATSDTSTDASGFATINLRYTKDRANWVQVLLSVKATVNGTESMKSEKFVLVGAASDFDDENVAPPGQPSPFGTSTSCSDAL